MIETIPPPAPPVARRKPARRREPAITPGRNAVRLPALATLNAAEYRVALALKRACEICNVRIAQPTE
jgi:hypothetical protein